MPLGRTPLDPDAKVDRAAPQRELRVPTQVKTLISFADIQALHFQCNNCGASTTRPLDNTQKLPLVCENCNQTWFEEGSQDLDITARLSAALRAASESHGTATVSLNLLLRHGTAT